jgi:hypothetical protein
VIPRLHLPVGSARSIRHAVRLAVGSSLALGLAGVASVAGHGGVLPAGAQVDPVGACAPTVTTAGATTTLTFANVGTCTLSLPGRAGPSRSPCGELRAVSGHKPRP